MKWLILIKKRSNCTFSISYRNVPHLFDKYSCTSSGTQYKDGIVIPLTMDEVRYKIFIIEMIVRYPQYYYVYRRNYFKVALMSRVSIPLSGTPY